MFDEPRYATNAIVEKITLDLQILLWSLIDEQKHVGRELDYLQVFELWHESVNGNSIQMIVHSQERPYFINKHLVQMINKPVSGKVWVIDSGTYATMLFPDDY